MPRLTHSTRRALAAAAAAVLLLAVAPPTHADGFPYNPILFVHGIEGSGAQFESQAMRFTSNGYPASWIDEVDYNSTRAVGDKSEVDEQIDAGIAALRQRTGKSQVDVVAHSLGTSVMFDYLTNGSAATARKASVAHYINVDGQSSNPGVPTLAIWAGKGAPGRSMPDAQNVTIPNQTHVQTATSAESFVALYSFLTGAAPAADIVPETGTIEVAGKALNFPQNTGLSGATVQVWHVNDSGRRTTTSPLAAVSIADGAIGGGAFGPIGIQAGTRYEFTLVRTGFPTHHLYYEPFLRSDDTLRLLESDAISAFVGYRPGASGAVSIRYKELWGDQDAENDQLLVDGLDICTPALCRIGKQVNGMFVYDRNRDGKTDLSAPDPVFDALPFLQGADVFVAGQPAPAQTVSFQLLSRGSGPLRTLNIPNWDSMTDTTTIQWNDFE